MAAVTDDRCDRGEGTRDADLSRTRSTTSCRSVRSAGWHQKLGIEKLAQRESGEVLAKLKALLEEQPASTAPGA